MRPVLATEVRKFRLPFNSPCRTFIATLQFVHAVIACLGADISTQAPTSSLILYVRSFAYMSAVIAFYDHFNESDQKVTNKIALFAK